MLEKDHSPPAGSTSSLRTKLGEEVLGPAFAGFCLSLQRQLLEARSAEGDPVVLYVARAGLRLHELMRRFRTARGLPGDASERDFYVSRIAAAKACLMTDPEFVSSVIAREFAGSTLAVAVRHLTCDKVVPDRSWEDQPATAGVLLQLLRDSAPASRALQCYLREQSDLLKSYLHQLAGSSRKLILVDSGWTGNTQWMLMRSHSDFSWQGLYVGKWDYRGLRPAHFPTVKGLLIDASPESPRPRLARDLVRHYHVIEDPLEPGCASVQEYRRQGDDVVSDVDPPGEAGLLGAADEHFAGILRHFATISEASEGEIERRALSALRQLRLSILCPRQRDLEALMLGDRSADFGRRIRVPVLHPPSDPEAPRSIVRRLHAALWKEGQLLLEFPLLAPVIFSGRRALIAAAGIGAEKRT